MSTLPRPTRFGAWVPALAWGVVAYVVHAVGNDVGWYLQFGWYQNLTHGLSASAMAVILAVAGLRRGYRGARLVAFVVALSAALALCWEAVEYFGLLDPYGVSLHFHDFNDAMVDMAANAVGVSLALVAVWVATER